MKTVITAKDAHKDAYFDLRFGRGAFFCLLDMEKQETVFFKNEYAEAQGGAGTKAAEKMVELGVNKVISGDFGPKAKEILSKFNIQMVILDDDNKKIGEIIEMMS